MEIIFTKHAREMMEKRKISEDEVIQTIKHPEKLTKNMVLLQPVERDN